VVQFCIDRVRSHEANSSSHVALKVWHKSQSKKKAKKLNLVATASHSLAELLKKQEQEPHASEFFHILTYSLSLIFLRSVPVPSTPTRNLQELEIRLTCQSATRLSRPAVGRGRPQNGATLLLRLKPPSHFSLVSKPEINRSEDTVADLEESGYLSNSEVFSSSASTASSESLSSPPSSSPHPSIQILGSVDREDEDEDDGTVVPTPTPTFASLRKRLKPKRMRGYAIDSEDEVCSTSADESGEEDMPRMRCFSDGEHDGGEDEVFTYTEIINVSSTRTQTHTQSRSNSRGLTGWFAASILPSHTFTQASTSTSTTLANTESGPGSSSSSFSKASFPKFADKITAEPDPEHALQDMKENEEKGNQNEKGEDRADRACETEAKSDMNIAEKVLASFTTYEFLKRAEVDSEYERVFEKLQLEWCFVGGLVGLSP
jgi:hypothetical protein